MSSASSAQASSSPALPVVSLGSATMPAQGNDGREKSMVLVAQNALSNVRDSQKTNVSAGRIIVLTGIVSAGKSSMVKAIQSIDKEYHEEDLDLRRDPTIETTREMVRDMLDDTINRSLTGKKTVISLFKIKDLVSRILERGIKEALPITTVLLHCPFHEIPSRLDNRNTAAESPGGNPANYRNPSVAIDQYASLYVRKMNGEGIEKMTRATAIACYTDCFDKMIAHARRNREQLPSNEQIEKDRIEMREAFLIKLGFTDASVTEIAIESKAKYDFTIDTSSANNDSAREAFARQILRP